MENKQVSPEELFAQLANSEEAKIFAQNVEWADEKFDSQPLPQLKNSALESLKAKVDVAIAVQKAVNMRRVVYKAAAVAAVFAVVSVLLIKTYQPQGIRNIQIIELAAVSSAVWQSEDITSDDPDLATLSAETEDIENDLVTIDTETYFDDQTSRIDDLELELINIDSDFWKG
ncbi:MAG: hypothetical protein H8D47_05555 [Planctomycetes bacterium]|nr:hypothetical protein [Planctomycetota bacterium]